MPVHTTEIQGRISQCKIQRAVHTKWIPSRFTHHRSKADSANGDSKAGHSMGDQSQSHNGHPNSIGTMEIVGWFAQWKSKAASHNGDPKLVYTMPLQSRFTQCRSEASSHNGDPKSVHTMEIQICFGQ